MRAASRKSTGFAVLRREANEGGYFRPVVQEVVERYLHCGHPHSGFARIRCPDCHGEQLLTFSCKTRGFCPSCHAKRLGEWGEWVRETLLLDVPHRQVVLTIPKRGGAWPLLAVLSGLRTENRTLGVPALPISDS